LPTPKKIHGLNEKTLLERQRALGYTIEDLKLLLQPMALNGIEATGSMGADTPLAVLSYRPQLLFNYFKQLFAQVTNPPIDPIREEIVMDEAVMLGSEGNILEETPARCHRLRVPRPVVTNADLEKIRNVNQGDLKATTLSTVFQVERNENGETIDAGGTLKKSLENLFQQADKAINNGYTILVLSDRDLNRDNIPIPTLLVCSGLHHHLIRRGTRTKVSLVLETGEAREMHHFAVLIGYSL